MVRQITPKTVPPWKSVLAIIVVGGGLLWHTLACNESPMAFSPDGDKLAFVTMEPYDADDVVVGSSVFRLMVLSKDRKVQVIEETDEYVLSGPAYSPDGKNMCYLRIPRLTEEKINVFERHYGELRDRFSEIESNKGRTPFGLPASVDPNSLKKLESIDLTLPPVKTTLALTMHLMTVPPTSAVLVVRDASNYSILSCIEVKMPIRHSDKSVELFFTYLTVKPQYSPDSQWIYLPAGLIVRAINPTTGKERHLGSPMATVGHETLITIAELSPDGKTIAALMGDDEAVLALLATDGRRAIYQRLQESPSFSGIAWIDDNMLVLLYPDPEKCDKPDINTKLDVLRTDGSLIKSLELALPKHDDDDGSMGELALASDGKHMVFAFGPDVFFLTTDGRLLKHYHSEEEMLVQPTFTPDSKLVVFKLFKKEEERCSVIGYFTPNGGEAYRVEIPPTRFVSSSKESDDKEKTVTDGSKD